MGSGRASVRYLTTCPDDTVLRERFTALAQKRRRVGHRRLHVLLRREGHVVNRKRIQRLYREENLMVRRRGDRKRGGGARAAASHRGAAGGGNQRWSLDFVSD
jgi:putative transposase